MNPFPDPATLSKRASKVVLAMLLVAAVSGYFMGLNQTRGDRAAAQSLVPLPAPNTEPGPHQAPPIVAYTALGDSKLKPNADWQSSLLTLVSATPAPLPTRSVEEAAFERALAVEKRRSRRAFDGAPPVIPHPVDPTSPASCKACHERGLVVRDLVAPRMSHGELGICTQCHVPSGGNGLPALADVPPVPVFAGNVFNGVQSSGSGSRAWPGAPPTIPHTVQMRENCASCHGVTGLPGLRTSHPERTLCVQCHVPETGAGGLPWQPAPWGQHALLQPSPMPLP